MVAGFRLRGNPSHPQPGWKFDPCLRGRLQPLEQSDALSESKVFKGCDIWCTRGEHANRQIRQFLSAMLMLARAQENERRERTGVRCS